MLTILISLLGGGYMRRWNLQSPALPPPSFYESLHFTSSGPPNLAALDIIAALACAAAVILLILSFSGLDIPRKNSALCVLLAVAAWTLNYILNTYLWLVALLGVFALALFVLALIRSQPNGLAHRRPFRLFRS